MKNKQRKLSLMLSVAVGVSSLTPLISMADAHYQVAVPISFPIETTVSQQVQKSFMGGFATITEILDDQIVVSITHKGSENAQNYILNISEATFFVDNETGAASSIDALKVDDQIYVYHSMASTRSLPAQTAAFVILTNVQENQPVATLIDVESISENENGISALTQDGEYVIHITEDTNVLPYRTRNRLHYTDVKENQRLLVWFNIVMPSFPAQATALKAVVFPSTELSITYAELVRDVIVQIDGDKPMLMDTHYARPYMMKAKELGLITEHRYNNEAEWNLSATISDYNTLVNKANALEMSYDAEATSNLILNDITIDGETLPNAKTLVKNGSIMVPLRAVGEALGYEVIWNAETRSITLSKDSLSMELQLGYNNYNGEELGSSPQLVEGTTYVPLDLFAGTGYSGITGDTFNKTLNFETPSK